MLTYGLLIFNRNDVNGVLRLTKLLNDAVDEIVIIDSSDPPEYKRLMDKLTKRNLKRAVIFRAIPLGYAEPLRMYGLSKVNTDYILLLDTDEIPNTKLIEKLRYHDEYDGYVINRYEVALKIVTKQLRLFKRKKILFRGIIHENPEVLGQRSKLPDDEYILHMVGKLNALMPNYSRYMVIELFSRYPYLLNNLLIRSFRRRIYYMNTNIINILNAILILTYYKAISLFQLRDADMWFPYFMNLFKVFMNIPNRYQKVLIDISREIYESDGIISYLCLNNPSIVESLTETYTWNLPGHKVFQYLILYRYKYKKCATNFKDVLETFHLKPHK